MDTHLWTDGYGRWYAAVAPGNDSHARAYAAVLDEITVREQRTGESWQQAQARVSASLSLIMAPMSYQLGGAVVYREDWNEG